MVETLIIGVLLLAILGVISKPFVDMARWVAERWPHTQQEEMPQIQAITIIGDCPIINLSQLDGKPITFHAIHEYQTSNEQIWVLQLENNGPLTVWTDDAAQAWQFNKAKKGTTGMVIQGQFVKM